MKKKICLVLMLLVCVFGFTGCQKKEANVDGTLEEIMTKVYAGINEDELPMGLENMPVDDDNVVRFLGTDEVEYEEALASESGIGSMAHSVVLVRLNDDATKEKIEETKKLIKENADPRKWICVEAENVYVESKGNLIILIMTNEQADAIKANFNNLE